MRTIALKEVLDYSGDQRSVPHHRFISSKRAELGALYTTGGKDPIPLLHTCLLDNTPHSEWLTHRMLSETISLGEKRQDTVRRSGSQRYDQMGYLIGLLPKNVTMKRMSVRPSLTELEFPEFGRLVIECMETIWKQAKRDCAKLWKDMMKAPRVSDEWSLGNTPFTTAQVNLTASLPYHRDRGNLPWSPCSMLILKQNTEGGHLHIPQLDLLVPGDHGTIVTFYQDSLWHGVTPIEVSSKPRSARVSVVGYVNRLVHKELADIGAGNVSRAAMRTGTKVGQIVREGAMPESMRRALMGTPVRFEGDE